MAIWQPESDIVLQNTNEILHEIFRRVDRIFVEFHPLIRNYFLEREQTFLAG